LLMMERTTKIFFYRYVKSITDVTDILYRSFICDVMHNDSK
jgi:hypothetical protein